MCSVHSRRRRNTSLWRERYTNASRSSNDSHTDMFTRIRSSSNAWIEVALPFSVCRRQTKPGLSSAIALIGSSISTKPAIIGESMGALNRAMLICASCQPATGRVYPAFKPPPCRTDPSSMGWLVVVLVLVGAAAHAIWRARRGAARQRRLMLLCDRAGLDFAAVDLRGDTAWLPFPMFGAERHGTENVVSDPAIDGVYAFDLWYEEQTDERSGGPRHRLTCAVVPFRSSCPRLRVTPRDAGEDPADAFGHEVHLELEAFERRFRVQTEDPRFAFAFLDQRLMEALLALPEHVTAEVREDVLLLSAPILPPEQVLVLFDTAAEIHRRIPRVVSSLFPPRPERGEHEARWLQGRWSPESTGGPA